MKKKKRLHIHQDLACEINGLKGKYEKDYVINDPYTPLPKHINQTNAGQACDMLEGSCSCGAWHKSTTVKNLETKLCQRFKKVLMDIDTLWFMFSIYVGERQIERGDVFTHEEVFKQLRKRIKGYGKRMAK